MKISNPFAKKKGKSRAVTSRNSKSKKSKPKNKKVLAYFGIIAVLFVTSVTYGGFVMYKREALKAEAHNWTYLDKAGIKSVRWARACKITVNSGYGQLYRIKFQLYRNSSPPSSISIAYVRKGQGIFTQTVQTGWLYGVVAGAEAYVSKDLGDRVQLNSRGSYHDFNYQYKYDGNPWGTIDPRYLANC